MNLQHDERVEEMAAFFDLRAAGYDAHMREDVFSDAEFVQFYQAMSAPIERTEAPVNILDLGCGTGLEIEPLLERAPNALITGIDLSGTMLDRLKERYAAHMDQITLVTGSYLTMPFAAQTYDYVISAMSVHHVLHYTKRNLYRKIHGALKPGGRYIEGDSVVPVEMESQFIAEYLEQIRDTPEVTDGHYHVDVPFSIETQRTLLMKAGFRNFEIVWQRDGASVWGAAVYVVTQ